MAIDRQVTPIARTHNIYPDLFRKYLVARLEYLLNLVRQDDFVHSASHQEKLIYTLRTSIARFVAYHTQLNSHGSPLNGTSWSPRRMVAIFKIRAK